MKISFNDYLNLSRVLYSPQNKEATLQKENRTTALLMGMIDQNRDLFLNLEFDDFQTAVRKEARRQGISVARPKPDWINLFTFTQTRIKSIVLLYLCLFYLKKPVKFPMDLSDLDQLNELQINHILSII